MCLKIKTGPFHSPAETTDINNSSDLVFLQKWKNQAFSRFFFISLKTQPCLWRKTLKTKEDLDIFLPQLYFDVNLQKNTIVRLAGNEGSI